MDTPADLSFVTVAQFAAFLQKPSLVSDATSKANLTEALGAAIEAVEAVVGPLDNDVHTVTAFPSASSLVLPDSHILEPVLVVGPNGDPVALSRVDLDAGVLSWPHHLADGPHKVTYTTREHGYSVKMAVKIIASHLYDVNRGNQASWPTDAMSPVEDPIAARAGFAIPRRATQLLAPFVRGQ